MNGLYEGQIRDEKTKKTRDPNLQFTAGEFLFA